MARPLRIDNEDGWHHVMNRGAGHARIFLDDTDRVEFGARLADVHDRFGVQTHAYCLLDTHYHALVYCPQGGLSDAMQRLGSIYTRHVNDRLGRDGALFRGRFHSKPVDDDRYLLAAVRYIHRNALDVAGVGEVDRYRWSSHRAYLGLRRPALWLRTDVVLAHFGGDRDAFHEFVRIDDADRSTEPGPADLVAMLGAANLVVLELGLGDQGRARGRRSLDRALLGRPVRGVRRRNVDGGTRHPECGGAANRTIASASTPASRCGVRLRRRSIGGTRRCACSVTPGV